jgi:phosphoribosylformimino-5-aminoimidazole carboxamide ribotide isomerase
LRVCQFRHSRGERLDDRPTRIRVNRGGTMSPMAFEIIPSVDLRGGRVVRLKQGDYEKQITYDVDPIETARSFADAGARWMHIVDLDGAKEGRPMQTPLVARMIAASGLNVQAGGGVRTREDIDALLDAGAKRVVIGTRAVEDWPWLESLIADSKLHDKLVLALDAKDGVIATRGWTHASKKLAVDVAKQVSSWPLAAILYTDVARDGMLQGPNFEQTRCVAEAGAVPVIASGGVGKIEHLQQLRRLNLAGVVVGRSLYEGAIDLKSALTLTRLSPL